uniref:Uncharacterized protein n=1 Tax=mine drainage metagenome TaxID=410659 RepID=E6PTV4_9ZZZZ
MATPTSLDRGHEVDLAGSGLY